MRPYYYYLLLLLPLTTAHPSSLHFHLSARSLSPPPTALSILLHIAPSSSTCLSAPVPSECAPAWLAAPYLITAMSAYNVTHPAALAALLSLIAYETAEFKYNTNHFPAPGRPGQGTRNMQMAQYNLLYARSIPQLRPRLDAITTDADVQGLSDEELDAVRALVLPHEYAWGSAAWFLESQCGEDVKTGLETAGEAGWEGYMGCVGTGITQERREVWERANVALGISR